MGCTQCGDEHGVVVIERVASLAFRAPVSFEIGVVCILKVIVVGRVYISVQLYLVFLETGSVVYPTAAWWYVWLPRGLAPACVMLT